MNDFSGLSKSAAAMCCAGYSVEGDEPSFVGQDEHAPIGDHRSDVYRRADIELRLHLAASRTHTNQLTSIGREPKAAARQNRSRPALRARKAG